MEESDRGRRYQESGVAGGRSSAEAMAQSSCTCGRQSQNTNKGSTMDGITDKLLFLPVNKGLFAFGFGEILIDCHHLKRDVRGIGGKS
jgi:hypothetical protein